jgi:hypothetical protein
MMHLAMRLDLLQNPAPKSAFSSNYVGATKRLSVCARLIAKVATHRVPGSARNGCCWRLRPHPERDARCQVVPLVQRRDIEMDMIVTATWCGKKVLDTS